jgi:DNA-binding transcriptional LysR family regulator
LAKSLKSLDLNLLVVFEAIYSCGNVSRAARQLGMSQPAASNALARLRLLMDDPLFLPEQRGVAPTAKAKRMIGPVRQALGIVKDEFGTQPIDFANYTRRFRVLLADPFEAIIMPPVLRFVAEHAPGISVECVRTTPSFLEQVRSGDIDLACFAYAVNAPDIVVKPIRGLDVVIIARRGHPSIGKRLDVETFTKLGHVVMIPELRALILFDQDIVAHGLARRMVYAANKLWSILPIVERTDLIGALPRWYAEAMARNFNITIHEVPVQVSNQHIYMLWNTKNDADPGHRWLRDMMLNAGRGADAESREASRVIRLPAADGPARGVPRRGQPKIA